MPTKKTTKASTKKAKDPEEISKPQEIESNDPQDDPKAKKQKFEKKVGHLLRVLFFPMQH